MALLANDSGQPTRVRNLVITPPGAAGAGNEPSKGVSKNLVGVLIQVPTGQTANGLEVRTAAGGLLYSIAPGGLVAESSADTITAFATGGQTNATQLTSVVNRITVVATAGDSVKLPAAAAGLDVLVINHGANALQVFGAGTDQIDDVATATGVSQ